MLSYYRPFCEVVFNAAIQLGLLGGMQVGGVLTASLGLTLPTQLI